MRECEIAFFHRVSGKLALEVVEGGDGVHLVVRGVLAQAQAQGVARLGRGHPERRQHRAGGAAAATTALGAGSLPGTVSFVTSIAPIAMAMGVPVEPLALLIAVETFPDIMRTLGNVTMDMAITATVSKRGGDPKAAPDQ